MKTDTTRGKWYGPWCSKFASLLEERRLNPSDFALLAGDRQNNVWQYLRGVIRPPLQKLDIYAKKLKLDDRERAKFIKLGRLAHAPQEIREEMELLRNTQEELRAELLTMKDHLRQLGVDPTG